MAGTTAAMRPDVPRLLASIHYRRKLLTVSAPVLSGGFTADMLALALEAPRLVAGSLLPDRPPPPPVDPGCRWKAVGQSLNVPYPSDLSLLGPRMLFLGSLVDSGPSALSIMPRRDDVCVRFS